MPLPKRRRYKEEVMTVVAPRARPGNHGISQLISTDGYGTVANANMAAGTAAVDYFYRVPATEVHFLTRMLLYIEDGINEKFGSATYSAAGALANGINIYHMDGDDGTIATLNPLPIKR